MVVFTHILQNCIFIYTKVTRFCTLDKFPVFVFGLLSELGGGASQLVAVFAGELSNLEFTLAFGMFVFAGATILEFLVSFGMLVFAGVTSLEITFVLYSFVLAAGTTLEVPCVLDSIVLSGVTNLEFRLVLDAIVFAGVTGLESLVLMTFAL